jgi:hypothetical protein
MMIAAAVAIFALLCGGAIADGDWKSGREEAAFC